MPTAPRARLRGCGRAKHPGRTGAGSEEWAPWARRPFVTFLPRWGRGAAASQEPVRELPRCLPPAHRFLPAKGKENDSETSFRAVAGRCGLVLISTPSLGGSYPMGPVPRSSANRWMDVFASSLKKRKEEKKKRKKTPFFCSTGGRGSGGRAVLPASLCPAWVLLGPVGLCRVPGPCQGCALSTTQDLPVQQGAQGTVPFLQGCCCCHVELASAHRGETRRKHWILGLEKCPGNAAVPRPALPQPC